MTARFYYAQRIEFICTRKKRSKNGYTDIFCKSTLVHMLSIRSECLRSFLSWLNFSNL